jgi:hypothetical protein
MDARTVKAAVYSLTRRASALTAQVRKEIDGLERLPAAERARRLATAREASAEARRLSEAAATLVDTYKRQ